MSAPSCARPTDRHTELGFDRDELRLDYSLRQYVWSANEPERFVQQWHVQATAPIDIDVAGVAADPTAEAPVVEVARADLVRVDLDEIDAAGASVYDLLDAESADLEMIAAQIFEAGSGQLHDDLNHVVVAGGGSAAVLVLDQVWVAPPYRGHEIGPVVAAVALEALASGCGLAVCFPSPFENRPDDDRELAEAVAHLGRVWAKVGFEPYGDTGVHVLDLGTTELSRCLARLTHNQEAI